MADVVLLLPEFVLPSPDPSTLLTDAGIAVIGDRIASIEAPERLRKRWPQAQEIELPDCLVMPGLVNAHQHGRGISQVLLGYSDDYLEAWIASRRGRGVLDPYPVTKLAAARMLANGVTSTIHANYTYGGDYEAEVRASLRAYDEAGIRATMCIGAQDQGLLVYPPHEACFLAGLPDDLKTWLTRSGSPPYAGDASATIALMSRLLADYGGHPRLRFCYGPAGPQWVSDGLWRRLTEDAAKHDLGLHLHALESPAQAAACAELYPDGVFHHLAELGAMTPRTVVAHGVWVKDADMEILARTGATVVRNPGCNLRLRNGIAPVGQYLEHGVRLAVGTDNTALADDEDLLRELRLAALLAREPDWSGRPSPNAATLLTMVTVNGAVAAQTSPDVGTLEPGRKADLVALSLDRVRRPYLDPDTPILDAVLARAQGSDVRLTMVDGCVVYRDGRHSLFDIEDVEHAAAAAAGEARRPADPENVGRTRALRDHLVQHYSQQTAPRTEQDGASG